MLQAETRQLSFLKGYLQQTFLLNLIAAPAVLWMAETDFPSAR